MDADDTMALADTIDLAVAAVRGARRVAVLTGAGISTDSGIPDFRGPDGIWTRDPDAEKYSTIGHYLADGELRERAWRYRMANPAWTAEPNAGHRALVDLERSQRLELLVTQNIDGLHVAAGSDPDRVVEVHGSIRGARCVDCDWRGPTLDVLDRVRAGEPDPPCTVCGGILKTSTVFFGESLDEHDLDRAFGAASACDLLLCVGTTLQVYPVAGMVPLALRRGGAGADRQRRRDALRRRGAGGAGIDQRGTARPGALTQRLIRSSRRICTGASIAWNGAVRPRAPGRPAP